MKRSVYTDATMPTRVSVAADLERELFTAEEFLDWLTPERFADLINGEISISMGRSPCTRRFPSAMPTF